MNVKENQGDGASLLVPKKRRKKWDIESWEFVAREIEAGRKKRLLADLGRLIYSSLQSSQLSQCLNSTSLSIESQTPEIREQRIQNEKRK